MRKHLVIILLAVAGLFLGTTSFTQEKKGPAAGDIVSKAADGQRMNAYMADKLIGSKVINLKGETLGRIENLVVDIDTGRIIYAVLESGDFLGVGDKRLPVPWISLAALPSEGIFFLNQSKEQIAKAPAFDKNNLPNMATDMHWGEGIFTHYAVPGYEQPGPIGLRYGYVGYVGYDGNGGCPMHPGQGSADPYKTIFDSKTIKTISGQVIKVDQVPEPGFGLEMRLTVFIEQNKEILPVYLGPAFYIVGFEHAKGFHIGDKVTVTGSQVTGRGEPFMLATTVKRGNEVLRLRDKDGTPEWVGWKTTRD